MWEKVAEGMQLVARNVTGFKARISTWAKGIGLKGNHNKMEGYTFAQQLIPIHIPLYCTAKENHLAGELPIIYILRE